MFTRFAIYFIPTGKLADFGACWLGWDLTKGVACAHPLDLGLDSTNLTQRPRRYGFHATIKPPFRLVESATPLDLDQMMATLCRDCCPTPVGALRFVRLGRFLALVPQGDQTAVKNLSARMVRSLDRFRRPPDDAELAKRRKSNLSAAHLQNLRDWGYAHVLGQFRFHITMTGPLDDAEADHVQAVLEPRLTPLLASPLKIDSLALVGEDQNGFFHLIQRYPLGY